MLQTNKNEFSVTDFFQNKEEKLRFINFLFKLFNKFLGLTKISLLYKSLKLETKDKKQFLTRLIEKLSVEIKFNKDELKRIPKDKPVILISNHPFGGLDGIILAKILLDVRPDFKIMANSFLAAIKEIKDLFIFVNSFKKNSTENIAPLRDSIKWLKNGHLLTMFPSGEVSHFQFKKRQISDPQWSQFLVKLLKTTEASVVPVFFNGHNSLFFQIIGCFHPFLRTVLLGKELTNKSKVELKIGRSIPYKNLKKIDSNKELLDYLRLRTYLLKEQIEEKNKIENSKRNKNKTEDIIEEVLPLAMEIEIKSLPSSRKMLDYREYSVFCANYGEIPFILREIGRLREITYREVGEGTGNSIDLDEFDKHYLHIFIWNNTEKEIVGAYRLGQLDKLLEVKKLKNLYTSTLFKFNMQFLKSMPNALELGRSFIRKKISKKALFIAPTMARDLSIYSKKSTLSQFIWTCFH